MTAMLLAGAAFSGGGPAADVQAAVVSDIENGTSSTASASFLSNGEFTSIGNVQSPSYTWLKRGQNSDFEIRATLNSGDTPIGTLGSWEALTSNRTWSLTQSGIGSKDCELTIEIRRADTGAVLDSDTLSLSANQLS